MTREQKQRIAKLMEEQGPRLYSLAYRITNNKAVAEDMVQSAFAALCQKPGVLDRHENLGGWLYKATYQCARREMDRACYKRNIPLETEEMEGPPGITEPMDMYLPKELRPQEREIILLRLEQGLDYEEIAARQGMTVDACRQSYSRAIRKCRRLYREVEERLAAAENG